MSRCALPVGVPYTSLPRVLDGLRELEAALRARGDRRAVFATAYVLMTEALLRGVQERQFQSGSWVEELGVCFANYYRRALLEYERARLHRVPGAWTLSFRTSERGRAFVLQDVVLGMNAHINHDLPLALADTIPPEGGARLSADYLRVLGIIHSVIEPIRRTVIAAYAPGLAPFDAVSVHVTRWTTYELIRRFRLRAWARALHLLERPLERRAFQRHLDVEACRLAWLILLPNESDRVLDVLRRLEAATALRQPSSPRGSHPTTWSHAASPASSLQPSPLNMAVDGVRYIGRGASCSAT